MVLVPVWKHRSEFKIHILQEKMLHIIRDTQIRAIMRDGRTPSTAVVI